MFCGKYALQKQSRKKQSLIQRAWVHAAMNDGLKWIAPPCKMPTADKAVRLHLMFDCGNSLKYIPNCREKYNEPSCTHHPAQKLTTWPITFHPYSHLLPNFIVYNTLLTRNMLIPLLLPEYYWLACFNFHLHNKSPATGVSAKIPQSIKS